MEKITSSLISARKKREGERHAPRTPRLNSGRGRTRQIKLERDLNNEYAQPHPAPYMKIKIEVNGLFIVMVIYIQPHRGFPMELLLQQTKSMIFYSQKTQTRRKEAMR